MYFNKLIIIVLKDVLFVPSFLQSTLLNSILVLQLVRLVILISKVQFIIIYVIYILIHVR